MITTRYILKYKICKEKPGFLMDETDQNPGRIQRERNLQSAGPNELAKLYYQNGDTQKCLRSL